MVWKGVIIEESLESKSLLRLVKIVDTRTSKLEGEEEKGEWHFHAVDVEDRNMERFSELAKNVIREKWWIHLAKGNIMIVILRGKVFRHERGNKKTLKEIREYVASEGIAQLPNESLMDRPYD